jgi:hypothetical protein
MMGKKRLIGSLSVEWWSIMTAVSPGALELWLRAFIPDPAHAGKAQGYIDPRPGNASQSIVRLIPTSVGGGVPLPVCFVTDHRGFSSSDSSTARLDTKFSISFTNTGQPAIAPVAGRTTAGVTTRVNCSDGSESASAPGSVDRDALGAPSFSNGMIQVIGQVTGTNNLAGPIAPSIDYSFDLKWTPWEGKLTAKLTYGSFPAFEVYARSGEGSWQQVIQRLPSGKPWSLAGDGLGINTESEEQSLDLPGADGIFQSNDADRRFTLQISGQKFTLTERNAAGQTLVRDTSVSYRLDGTAVISRPNDTDVLTFLGFQPALRAEILAAGPKPSFINASFNGIGLKADWYGLLVTKDAKAHLKELIQPGTKPPKTFSLLRT